jgi:sporulation protein YlmC with PRC-barrel domain
MILLEETHMQSTDGEQRIDIGTDVVDKAQQKVGTVAYVVVRPPEMEITDIVVSTGPILGRDIVVPRNAVSGVEDGKICLSVDKDQVGRYPNYVDIDYTQPPADWIAPPGLTYPAGGMLVPQGMYTPEIASVEVNVPAGTVGLHQGMDVESSDGHRVGSIDALDTDASSGDVTGLIVKHGFLFTHDVRIPATDVAEAEGDRVTLRLSKDEVQRLEAG